ncbi:hypothetical protein SDC9_124159 [bioreactor metagenome]|jgi:hypothetical protein|uniref:Lipoprotein n=1 Tax=bioreactor metagenome TaxID=1076179 RepID=A0A645CJN8_9ZZZZ
MKKSLSILITVAILSLLIGCTTSNTSSRPLAAYSIFPADSSTYTILGEVYAEGEVGYLDLLDEARAVYPGCDDVVNIKVDVQSTTVFSFFTSVSTNYYVMSGIAISYK